MMVLIFGLSFVASAYSIWRATRSSCDQREANLALGVLPLIIAALIYFGYSPYEKIVAMAIMFAAGIALVGEPGWRKVIPAYQVLFAIFVMIGMVNTQPAL